MLCYIAWRQSTELLMWGLAGVIFLFNVVGFAMFLWVSMHADLW